MVNQGDIKGPPHATRAGGADRDGGLGRVKMSEDERRGCRRVKEWMDGMRACLMLWQK